MRAMSDQSLYAYMIADVVPTLKQQLTHLREEQIIALVRLYKERTKTVRELAHELCALNNPPTIFNHQELDTLIDASTPQYLNELIQTLEALDTFTVDLLTDAVKVVCKRLGIKLVQVAQPIRLALVGKTTSPGIFELMAIIGKAETIHRLRLFMDYIKSR